MLGLILFVYVLCQIFHAKGVEYYNPPPDLKDDNEQDDDNFISIQECVYNNPALWR